MAANPSTSEKAAEAARNLRVNLKVLRDLGSAQVVGGTTIFVTLLLADLAVRFETFAAFEAVYFALATVSAALNAAVMKHQAREVNKWWRGVNYAVIVAIVAVASFVGPREWPARPETVPWWIIVALSVVVACVGWVQRQAAEFRLDEVAAARRDDVAV